MRQAFKKFLVGIVRLLINLFGQGWRRRAGIVLREAMASNGYDEVIKEIVTPRGTVRFSAYTATHAEGSFAGPGAGGWITGSFRVSAGDVH